MRAFSQFACFDWSGQAVARPHGIAGAVARAGAEAPALVDSPDGTTDRWSRTAVSEWLKQRAGERADMLIGFDFSFALPFLDERSYFPEWRQSPQYARQLWQTIDHLAGTEDHLSASTVPMHPELQRHFRQQRGKTTVTGDLFAPGLGRLRVTERHCREQKRGNAVSCFNLVGAAQVGKASLTGMRMLHRLGGAIPIWPFDSIPDSGPMIVEIYTGIAARAAGLSGTTKLRNAAALDRAMGALGSAVTAPLPRYDDHSTDALLGSAWLRRAANEESLWNPGEMTKEVRHREGWTFGVA